MSDDAIPAATLVLFRESGAGPAEHLFVERAGTMAFAAGAIVFPGGRVDAGDRRLAEAFADLDPGDAAARVAAVRETIEEAGVAVGINPRPDAGQVAALRSGLLEGTVFADLLGAQRLSLDPSPLVPFARWRPNFRETRVFDTRFYLAEAAGGAASVDATENVRLFWATAQFVLDEAAAGRVKIIFPTRRNLERLAALGNFAAARAQAAQIAPETISPWIEDRAGAPHLCIPERRGYPVTAEPMESVRRG
ncbi:MAG: NUDIX hydrolase [Sphingomonadaceae bacterium]|nr:NUDIX hydrolase [Sphingomonadaceae bacterium]